MICSSMLESRLRLRCGTGLGPPGVGRGVQEPPTGFDTVWVGGPKNHPLGSQWGGFCRTRSGLDLGPYIIICYSFILNRLKLISIFLYSFYIAL